MNILLSKKNRLSLTKYDRKQQKQSMTSENI